MGDKFKIIRMRLCMTQKQFSDFLGIKQSYYSSIERGEKRASAHVINALITMGIPANWLYSDTEEDLPVLEINTNKLSHRSVIVSKDSVQKTPTVKNDNSNIEELPPLYREGKISLSDIVNTFARFSFERYRAKHNTDFDVDSFSKIAEKFNKMSKFFELLQILMKEEIESKNRETLLNKTVSVSENNTIETEDDIINKYDLIYKEYNKYSEVIDKIIALAISSNDELKEIIHKIVERGKAN